MTCTHSAAEQDVATHADGRCPLCLAARVAALEAALEECANDLDASVKAEYRDALDYPSVRRKFERDMAPVNTARRLLGK